MTNSPIYDYQFIEINPSSVIYRFVQKRSDIMTPYVISVNTCRNSKKFGMKFRVNKSNDKEQPADKLLTLENQ